MSKAFKRLSLPGCFVFLDVFLNFFARVFFPATLMIVRSILFTYNSQLSRTVSGVKPIRVPSPVRQFRVTGFRLAKVPGGLMLEVSRRT